MAVATATVAVKTSRQHRDFESLKKRVRSTAHRAAYNYARAVVKEAKLRAPVRTGYLKSQIQWKRIKPGVFDVFVNGNTDTESGAFYAVYVEYGTRNMAAQPFFRPAIEMQKKVFMAEMKAVFRDA